MASKALGMLVMGAISLLLFTVLFFVTIGQSHAGPVWLWTGWVASVVLTGLVLWQTETARSAWGYLSLTSGIVSFVLFAAIIFVPVSASAPYEPGADWTQSRDIALPIAARLREALASAYFAIAVVVLGAILLSASYFLLRFRGPPRHSV